MKYNKRFLQKTDDKKHLRKVKKNWVVVSMASFAFLGGAAVLTSNTTEGPANASEVTQTVATHDQVETKTTTRTIKLVDKDTKQEIANVEPIKQTVNWTRTNKVDDQGNVVSEGTWQAVDQNDQYATLMYKDLDLSSKGYTTPQIDGKDVTKADAKNASGQTITENDDKTADGQDVVKVKAEAADVNKGDEEVTVTYTKAATTANTTSTQAAQTTAAAQTTEATGTKEVTNTKTTTRTIKYVAPDYDDQEMAKTVTQTINWKQVNTVDATGKVVKEGTWEVADSSNGKYAAVTTPTVANFTVDQATVAEQKATADDKDQTITVKYSFAGATEAADTPELRATQKGSYGSVDYTYDTSTDTLTFTTTGSFPDTNAGGTIFDKFPNVKHIVFDRGVYAAANSSSVFANLRKLQDFTNLDKLDTSRTRDMSYMFSMGAIQNLSLKSLDLSHFDTSKVTSMQFMFQNLGALRYLDISNFKMSAATDAMGDSQMFDLLGDGNTIYVNLPKQHFNQLADLGSVDGATGGDSKYPLIIPIGKGSFDQPQGPGMSTDAYRNLYDSGRYPGGWYLWGRDTKWTDRKKFTQTIRAVDSKGNVIKILRVETGEFIRTKGMNWISMKPIGDWSDWKLDTNVRSEYSEYELPQSFTLDNVNYTTPTINGTHRYWIGTRDIKQSDEVEDVIYAADVPTDNHGTDTDQTITRKVHLRDESNGNAEFDADNIATRTETIHFHRSGTVNSLTGVFTPTTSWAAVDGSASFAGYAAPDMKAKGYDLDKPATTDAITPSQEDITSGKSYDQDVFYKHHTGKVTPDGPVGPVDPDYPPVDPANLKKQLTKTYTRTVHFIDATGKKLAADKVETITATGEADYDYVTGQIVGDITWSYQSDSDKDWEAVTPAASINLDGKYYYDPQSDQSLAQKSFDIQNDAATNEDVNVTYKTGTDTSESKTIQRVVHLRDASDGNAEFDQDNLADRTQTLTFTRAGYKDEEGNFHATGEWVAEPSTDDSFAAFKTPDETAKGYDFDRNATTAVTPSQDDITNGVSYNQDIFYTHHKGKITPDGPVGPVDPVYPPVNPDAKKQLVKAYTRTVHFVGTDGKTVAPDRVETVTASGEADYDYVTGQIVGAITWSYKAGSDETWAVVTPQATIEANGKHYYNPSANGSLAETSFDVQNDAATNADITVTYQTATPTDNHGTDTDKTAIRHVKLIDDTEGHEFDAGSVADSTISYHRDGYIDDATGAFIPAGDWTVVGGGASEFAGVDAPDKSSEGYDAGTPAKTDSVSVDKDSVNNGQVFDQEIHYNHHKANINPNTPKHDPKVGPDIPQSVLDSLVKEYKRTVHFKNRSGADLTDAQIQEIIYNGDAEYDYVTQKLVSTPTWTLKSGSADKWTAVNGAATIDKDGTHYVKADGADGQDPEANKTFDPATDAAIANQEDTIWYDATKNGNATDTDKDVSRTIYFQTNSGKTLDEETQTVHFHRDGYINETTNKFVATSDWYVQGTPADMAAVAAKDFRAQGYVPDTTKQTSVDALTPDKEATSEADQTIWYKDNTGNITPNTPKHDPNNGPDIPDAVLKSLVKTYTRTVHFVGDDGKTVAPDEVETVTAYGEAEYDYATQQIIGNITWSYKTGSDEEWAVVTPKSTIDLDGKHYYAPSSNGSLAATSFDVQKDAATNADVTVTYKTATPTNNHGTDTDKSVVRHVKLIDAKTNQEFDAGTVADATLAFHRDGYVNDKTGEFVPAGDWTVVGGGASEFAGVDAPDKSSEGYDAGTPATTATVDVDKDTAINGHVYEQTITYNHHSGKITPDGPVGPVDPVYPPVNPDAKKQLVKTYTRTVHFVGTDGKKVADDQVETITANGEADYDYVTGQIDGPITWSYKAGSDEEWAVVTPKSTVDANGKHYYAPEANGSLAATSFNVQNDAAQNADVTVTYKTATPTNNHGTDTDKSVTRHVKLIDGKSGNEFDAGSVADATIAFHRDGYVDDATGVFFPAGDWTVVGGGASEFAGVDAPDKASEGYDAGTPAKTDSITVDKDAAVNGYVYNQEITYNHHSGKITPDGPVGPVDPVYPPVNPDAKKQLVKTYTRTVHFVGTDGKKVADDQVETVTAYGEADYDYVTGQIDGPITWSYKAGSDEEWAVVTPKSTVDLDGKHYYDPSANGSLAATSFNVQNDAAENADVTVTYKTATPTNNHGTDTDKSVTRHVKLIDGKTGNEFDAGSVADATIAFHRDGYIDDASGAFIPAGDWTVAGGGASEFAGVNAPDKSAEGYEAGTPAKTESINVDKDTAVNGHVYEQTIAYNHHSGKITPDGPVGPVDPHGPVYPPVNPDVKKQLVKTYTRTVHFVGTDGKKVADDQVETVTAYGEADYDYVTGQIDGPITWSYKAGSDEEWAVVTPKSTIDLDGKHYYAPSANASLAAKSFDVQNDAAQNADVTVTYKTATPTDNHGTDTDKSVTRHVKLIDDTEGHEFDAGSVADATISYHRDGYIDDASGAFIPAGDWTVVGGGASEFAGVDAPDKSSEGYDAGTPAKTDSVSVDKDSVANGQVFDQEIHYDHHKANITPNTPKHDPKVGPDIPQSVLDSLIKDYKRTVHTMGRDGVKLSDDQIQEIIYDGEAQYDYVTQKLVSTPTWTLKSGSADKWAKVTPAATLTVNGKLYVDPTADPDADKTFDPATAASVSNQEDTIWYDTTHDANATDTDKDVSRTIYFQTNDGKVLDQKTQTVHFHRDGYVNEATKKFVATSDWYVQGTPAEMAAVSAEDFRSQGYVPDTDKQTSVNALTPDKDATSEPNQTIWYKDNVGKITPNTPKHDPNNGPDIPDDIILTKSYVRLISVSGSDGNRLRPDILQAVYVNGEAYYDYAKQIIIGKIDWSYAPSSAEKWEAVNLPATIDANGKHYYDPEATRSLAETSFDIQNDPSIAVPVNVRYKTATPTDNHGTDTDKSVIRHVKLIDGQTGNEFDQNSVADSTLHFHRDGYVDDATGAFIPAGDWTVVGGGASEFAGVDAPDKSSEGYDAGTPAKTDSINVDKDSAENGHVYDQEITYNHHKGKVTPDGPVGPVDPHGPVYPPVNPDVKKQLTKTYTRTVHFVGTDGKTVAPDKVETVTAYGEADYDYVTGQIDGPITWSYKSGSDESWQVVTPATTIDANGKHYYEPEANGSLAEKSFDVQNDAAQNSDVTVTYKTATPTDNHGTDTDKSVTRHVKLIDGKTGNEFDAGSVADATIAFHRDGYIDDASGAFIPAGDWTVVGGGASEFAGVDAPDKASEGYDAGTPAKTANIAVDKDTVANGQVFDQTITYNHHSGKVTPDGPVGPVDPHGPVYPPVNPDVKKQLVKTYTRTIHFVGDDGQTVAPDQVETVTAYGEADYDYVTGQLDGPITWSYKSGSAEAWDVVSPLATIDANGKHYYDPQANGSLAAKSFDVQNDAAQNADVTVTYKTATPTNNHGTDTDKSVIRHVKLIDSTTGAEFDQNSVADATIAFHRDGYVNDKTGEFIPAGDWTVVGGGASEFAGVDAPDKSSEGYDAGTPAKTDSVSVDKDTAVNGHVYEQEITYDHHKGNITPNTPKHDPKHGPDIPQSVLDSLVKDYKRTVHTMGRDGVKLTDDQIQEVIYNGEAEYDYVTQKLVSTPTWTLKSGSADKWAKITPAATLTVDGKLYVDPTADPDADKTFDPANDANIANKEETIWYNATHPGELTDTDKDVSRTIYFQTDSGKVLDQKIQTVHFHRDGYINEATNKFVATSDWYVQGTSAEMPAVSAEDFRAQGYVPDTAKQTAVDALTPDKEATSEADQTIWYKDNTGNITPNTPKHDPNNGPDIPDAVLKSLVKTYTRTVHFVGDDGKTVAPDEVETVTAYGEAEYDYATQQIIGNITWSYKTGSDEEWAVVTPKSTIDANGKHYYAPAANGSLSEKSFDVQNDAAQSVDVTVTYKTATPTNNHGTDTDKSVIRHVKLIDGKTGAEFDKNSVADATLAFHRDGYVNDKTGEFIPAGDWTVIGGGASEFAGVDAPDKSSEGYDAGTPAKTANIDVDKETAVNGHVYDQEITYNHHSGKITPDGPVGPINPNGPVYPPVNPDVKKQLVKTYTRTVHFVGSDGKTVAPDKVETITAYGEADYDYVTGQIDGPITWSYKSGSAESWAVVTPAATIDANGKHYYDPSSNGSLAEKSFDVQNDAAQNADVTVTYKTATPTNNHGADTDKSVIRHVKLIDGKTGNEFDAGSVADSTLSFHRDGYVDDATGAFFPAGDWTVVGGGASEFAGVDAPDKASEGYDAGTPAKTANIDVDKETAVNGHVYEQEITYNHHSGKITPDGPVGPVDPHGPVYPPVNPDVKKQLVKTYTRTVHFVGTDGKTVAPGQVETVTANGEADYDYVTGQIDGPITWSYKAGSAESWSVVTPAATIDANGKHYYAPVANGSLAEKSFDVQNDGAENTDVTVTYKTATPTNNHGADTDKTATRQFHLIDDTDGHEFDADSINDRTQTVHFHRDGFVDDATGDFIPAGDWQAVDGDGNFAAYTAPDESQKGYDLVSASEIAGQNVDKETVVNGENINVDIHYKHHKSHIGPNTPDDPKHGPKIPDAVRQALQAEVKRNIHFKDAGNPNGEDIAQTEVESVALNGDADYDFVTGKLVSAINWNYVDGDTFAAFTANDTIDAGDYVYRNPAPKNIAAAKASQTPVADTNIDVLYHKTRAVQPSDNATTDKDITRTINLVDADKNDALIKTDKQTTHFHREALYFDETTNQVVYGDWSANNDSKWAAYTAPDLSADNYLNPTPANLQAVDLTVDSQDQVANIAYSHKTHIIDPKHDVPGNKGGNNGGNTPNNGGNTPNNGGNTPNNGGNTPNNGGNTPNGGGNTPNNGGNTPSNWPDNVPASDLIHVITRTIKYENAEGQEIAPAVTQTVRFIRTAVYDDVTKSIISYGPWTADGASDFAGVTTPIVKGYENPNPAWVAEEAVNADTASQTVVVSYADEQVPAKPKAKVLPSTAPGLPEAPVTPAAPAAPTVEKPATVLPSTGKQATNEASFALPLMAATLSGMLFLIAKKRKEEKNQEA